MGCPSAGGSEFDDTVAAASFGDDRLGITTAGISRLHDDDRMRRLTISKWDSSLGQQFGLLVWGPVGRLLGWRDGWHSEDLVDDLVDGAEETDEPDERAVREQ